LINVKEKLSKLFSVLANPMRLAILELLMDTCKNNNNKGLCVNDINEHIPATQPQISKQLKIMTENEILSSTREKNKIFYQFAPQSSICHMFAFFEQCCAKYSTIKEMETE